MRTDNASLADRLRNAAPAERPRLKEEFVADLRGELETLLELLRGHDARARRIDPAGAELHAATVLQFARYAPAAELFVQLIDTRSTDYPLVSDEGGTDYHYFPFAAAAVAVGVPAIAALKREVATADPNGTRFQLSCLVLKEILGEELALVAATSGLEDETRKRQATHFVRQKPHEWDATLCSDYTP